MVIAVARRIFGPQLRGVILKGSAHRGDFVPGYSDIDIHAFIADEAMVAPRRPALRHALALQEALGGLEAADFGASALQLFFLSWSGFPWGWPGGYPLPGAYRVLYGACPPGFAEVRPADYLHAPIPEIPYWTEFCGGVIEQMIDRPDRRLPELARQMGTPMKILPYAMASLETGDPGRIWGLSAAEVRPIAEAMLGRGRPFSSFFALVRGWPVDPARAREMLAIAGQTALDVAAWHAERAQPRARGPR